MQSAGELVEKQIVELQPVSSSLIKAGEKLMLKSYLIKYLGIPKELIDKMIEEERKTTLENKQKYKDYIAKLNNMTKEQKIEKLREINKELRIKPFLGTSANRPNKEVIEKDLNWMKISVEQSVCLLKHLYGEAKLGKIDSYEHSTSWIQGKINETETHSYTLRTKQGVMHQSVDLGEKETLEPLRRRLQTELNTAISNYFFYLLGPGQIRDIQVVLKGNKKVNIEVDYEKLSDHDS